MRKFLIYYSFTIKDPKTDLVVQDNKGSFEVEANSMRDIDTDDIRAKVSRIAHDYRSDPSYYVNYSNYYRIDEIKD